MDINKDLLVSQNKMNFNIKDKKRLDELSNLVGQTKFSYFNNFLEEVKIYNFYKSYSQEMVEFLNSEQNAYNNKKRQYKFIYDYMVNPKINAGAEISGTEEKVIIYEGLILKIYQLFYEINSHYDTINIKAERNNQITIYNFNNFLNFGNNRELEAKFVLSSNKKSNIIAEYMSMLAIKFIIAHEIGHLYNGHCQYCSSLDNEKSVKFMMVGNENRILSNNDMQTLEMDSDAFAMCRLIDEIINSLYYDKQLLSIIGDKSNIYKILGFSIHGLFCIMRDEEDDEYNLENSHPPLIIRELLALNVGKVASNYLDSSHNDNADSLYKGMKLCDEMYCSIHNKKSVDLKEISDHKSRLYTQNLLENWKNIKPKLEPFSRTRLAD